MIHVDKPRHRHKNPFPKALPIGMLLDENCQCGAFRSYHQDTAFEYGHGPCPDLSCERFTWVSFVLAE